LIEKLRQGVLVGHKGEFRAQVFEKELDKVMHQVGVRVLRMLGVEQRGLMGAVV